MNARRLPVRRGRGSFMLEEEMEDGPRVKLPIDPAAAAARFMVRAILADPAVREGAGSAGGAVVVQVPDATWVELVADQWRMLARGGDDPARGDADTCVKPGSWVSFERPGTERVNLADKGDDFVEKALCTGAAVAGFSPVPDRALPPALLRAADLLVVIPPLTPVLMRRVLRAVTGRDWKGPIDPDLTRRLTPSILRLARRPGQDVPDYLARLEAVADKSRPKLRPGPRLEDLAGMDAAVAWGKRVIRDIGDLRSGVLKWADMDRGLLLYGPPGTGKTMFAEALARSSGLPLVGASFAQWQSTKDGNLGDCLRAMRKSFDDARQLAPSILMIDELDAVPDRSRADEKHRDYWTAVVTCFLELMDGLGGREGVLVIGATNNPDALDPAVLRSGRMDKLIGVQLPDAEALERILRHHLGGDLAPDGMGDAARRAVGGTGADCGRWVRSARQRARHERRPMVVGDLVREIGGAPMPPDVEERVSLHEAGHAIAATILRPGKLEQVFIGSAAGPAGWVLVKFEVRSTPEAIHARLLHHSFPGRLISVEAGIPTRGSTDTSEETFTVTLLGPKSDHVDRCYGTLRRDLCDAMLVRHERIECCKPGEAKVVMSANYDLEGHGRKFLQLEPSRDPCDLGGCNDVGVGSRRQKSFESSLESADTLIQRQSDFIETPGVPEHHVMHLSHVHWHALVSAADRDCQGTDHAVGAESGRLDVDHKHARTLDFHFYPADAAAR